MTDILWSLVAGALAGLASSVALQRVGGQAARGRLAPTQEQAPAPAEPADAAPAAEAQSGAEADPAPAPGPIAAVLPPLIKTLSPLAEEVSHPRELLDMPEFQAVVGAFERPDATMGLLTQYAFGSNWPAACAAFLTLAGRPERQSLCDQVVQQLPHTRPYVLLYVFNFLVSLEQRPPVGAVILVAPDWWQENIVIPGFIDDYFGERERLGDRPEFGAGLEEKAKLDNAECMLRLLEKIQHPFGSALRDALRNWQDTRIDREFLGSVGTLWGPADRDPQMVLPPAWQELFATAESAVRQSRPRSLLVCGDPRIGKTTFIKLLGERLERDGWTVFAASGSELMADQMYIGQLEGRIRKVVTSLHAQRKVIYYVPDFGQIASSGTHQGQSATMLDQLLPAIAAGNLILIGESSLSAATRLLQTRPSLRSQIEVVSLQPLDGAATSALATQVAGRIGEEGGLDISEQAIAMTMDLAENFLGTRQLPGGVLDLLKRAANRAIGAGEAALTPDSVIATLSQLSGLPPVILDTSQRVNLAQVRDFFARRVMGQDEAVRAVVDRIAMLKAGLTDPSRPIGVFLFAGPTGTGKTELAKTLAAFLFGSAERMARLDMSEFQSMDATVKILGQRDNGAAESLVERIRRQPFSVVLLDEFEKAHPNCWDLFLQIFYDGRLADANGREADFRHCIIILTSNLGATAHRGGGLGFRTDTGAFTDDQVLRAIRQTFRPEFVNRLDKIIVFQPLSRELMRGILHRELTGIQGRRGLRERAWAVEWEASAIEFLLDRGFSPQMGARPLKRAIDQLLLAPLAATLVEHRFPQGDQFLFVRSDGKKIEVEFVDPDADPAAGAPEADGENDVSLPAIILRQSGSIAERAALASSWRDIDQALNGEAWQAQTEALRLALADPGIWLRDDRYRIFSRLELADRISEAARTAERLFKRYTTSSERSARASRELAGRLALQLHNLRQGMTDFAADAPVDALLRVEAALDSDGEGGDAADWYRQLTSMYRQWATRRRMRIKDIGTGDGKSMPILMITGFGAFRTLKDEAGLHVLEADQKSENTRRTVARVAVVGGPERGLPAAGEFGAAAQLLAAAPATKSIVRRYRENPAPMVRDIAGGWRSGRLSAVLGGDFDLIGVIKRRQPAA